MKKSIVLFVSLLLLTLAFTNPAEKLHQKAMENVTSQVLYKKIDLVEKKKNPFILKRIASRVNPIKVKKLAENYSDKTVSRKNLVFFSLTKTQFNNGTHYLGFGILNRVFIPSQVESYLVDKLSFTNIIYGI
ncbi:DUF4359 domain-containing protein [Elizabethkingia sp. JS20170427COW]|uniref:DUF4359 domain-containing protein n=1 Tax=Elizabethkingia sp. JS20170427COW TaxID=2583851 RepID=UPI001110807C|nr:DUF4359 domain-containing protein [Elizabethkingia sp. JS20170427COW]QCX53773.1 DUF4359 domain-containing protein [Elizabethkingia sp. JS20170427COW]